MERTESTGAVADAVREIRRRIDLACRHSGREPGSVRLIAVTKSVAVDAVRRAATAGVADFAENHAKGLAVKAPEVASTWHFIGKVQRGTAALIAAHADVIHSAEPGGGLDAVARRAETIGKRIRCLAQVDYAGHRQGAAPQDIGAFLGHLRTLPGLEVIGLMTLPPPTANPEGSRPYFARLRELRDALASSHPALQELSMGMSADYEVAVEEGATMVRIGTALFGARLEGRARGGAASSREF